MYKIDLTKKSMKQLKKLDEHLRVKYVILFRELEINPFLGKLSDNSYHAHINPHWVAVWNVSKENRAVTINYVGARKDAPYDK